MLKKPDACRACPLYGNGMGFIRPEGERTSGVFLVGEAGGDKEKANGTPFVKYAASGSKLEEVFRLLRKERKVFRTLNVISCQPPGNKLQHTPYEFEVIARCTNNYLYPEIKKGSNSTVVALGNIPLRTLTKFTGESKENVSSLRGFPIKSEVGIVIPTYHPAYVRRGKPQYTFYLKNDIQKALQIAKTGWEIPQYNFLLNPSYQDLKEFYFKCKENPNLPIFYDIETDDSADTEEDERQGLFSNEITRIQFTLFKNQAITLTWKQEFFKIIQLIFLLPNIKCGFNSYNFDNPRIKAKGFRFEEHLIDLMWMMKHWQPGLERALQKVASLANYPEPWKHIVGENIELYGCHDTNSNTYIFEYLVNNLGKDKVLGYSRLYSTRIIDGIYSLNANRYSTNSNIVRNSSNDINNNITDKIPKGFLGHVCEFWPILDEARAIGLHVNQDKINKLETDLLEEQKKINKEIQELVPNELKNVEPKRKVEGRFEYGFKRPPQVLKKAFQEYDDSKGLTFLEFVNKKVDEEIEEKLARGKKVCKFSIESEMQSDGKVLYYKMKEFKPSSQQVIKYIEFKARTLSRTDPKLAKKYRVPLVIDPKSKQLRKSTGGKALEDLLDRTGDEVILRIIGDKETDGSIGYKAGIRSIQKVLKNDIRNWQPASDGAVHTTWGMIAASGQLDARSPNVLNASKHKPLGKIFREVIEAPEDYIYVEADKKSYHVATMGYAANDKDYIRFSQLDPHSYFTAYVAKGILGLPNLSMSDREILDICGRYKKDSKWGFVRQNISKIIVLGNQLGLGRRKIFINQNNLIFDPILKTKVKPFPSMEYVGVLQKMLADLFPKVERFKNEITKIADKAGRLVNDWLYQQMFWEVFAWQYDSETHSRIKVSGSEREKAIAFEVQSPAFGDIRDKLFQLRDRGFLEVYKFVSSIHDSFVFMLKRKLLDNFMSDVYPILCAPSRVLKKECCPNGLIVGVEVSYGRNFGNYDEVRNPEGMRELKWT